ncbi:MAG: IS30 family transposase [Marinagarivorans sp.]
MRLKETPITQAEIANILGCNQATISRELKRNRGERGYRHKQAQEKSAQRRRSSHSPHVLTPDTVIQVEKLLTEEQWSPDQISGWLLVEEGIQISHETIYRHIWADKRNGGTLYRHLRRRGKKYQHRGGDKTSRGQIKDRCSIDERPAAVDEKIEVGHWEIDTVIGKNHSGAVVTLVERTNKYFLCARVMRRTAEAVAAATIALLTPFKSIVKSITSDNGKEFAEHVKIASTLECDFYFAHPYHSWERGLNENTNGLLRQYFPKNTDFKRVSDADVQTVMAKLNRRPRKTLGYATPAMLMEMCRAA